MFADFNKAFKEKNIIDKIPQPIIDALSEKLPKGFKYVNIGKDVCAINSSEEEMIFSFESLKENEFNAKTVEELGEYLYRTQKVLEIKSEFININGKEFKLNDLVKSPLKDVDIDGEEVKIFLKPPQFPDPFKIKIMSEDGNQIELKVQRQPYKSLEKSLFKSIENDKIEISYIIDEVKNSVNFNIKVRLDKAENLEEIIKLSKILKEFKEGKLNVDGHVFEGNSNLKDYKELDSLIEFWERVYKLSKTLNLNFKPKDDIYKEEVETIDIMYKSFIEKNDFQEFIDINNFTLTFKNKVDLDAFNKQNEMIMQFEENIECSILGENLSFYSVKTFSNFKVKDVLEDEKENFIYHINVDPITDEGILKKIRFFLDENKVKEYRKQNNI